MKNMSRNRVPSYLEAGEPATYSKIHRRPQKRVPMSDLLDEADEDNSIESNLENKDTAARIFLRLRPTRRSDCLNYEVCDNILTVKSDPSSTKNEPERQYTFSGIFDECINQRKIYDSVKSSIESEENLTILTYGTSGSGKTFTLMGDDVNPGIIPRSLEHLFIMYENCIGSDPAVKVINGDIQFSDETCENEKKFHDKILTVDPDIHALHKKLQKIIKEEHNFQANEKENRIVFIWISFAEIYNEIIYDLLSPIEEDPGKRQKLRILSSNDKIFIKDLTSIYVKNSLEAYTILMKGIKRVKYASTGINDHSSRSHFIFFVNVIIYQAPDTFTHITHQFCDLAGSERQKKAANFGARLKEANSINSSLTVLSRCLHAAHNNQNKKNQDIVPYRESKLTMLLRNSLLGKEKFTVIVNLSPDLKYADENLNVLNFSNIAKSITYKPSTAKISSSTRYSWFAAHVVGNSRSIDGPSEAEILYDENITLRSEIERLQGVVQQLEDKLIDQEFELRKSLTDQFQQILSETKEFWQNRLEQKEQFLQSYYEARIEALSSDNSKRKRPTENNTTIDLDESDSN